MKKVHFPAAVTPKGDAVSGQPACGTWWFSAVASEPLDFNVCALLTPGRACERCLHSVAFAQYRTRQKKAADTFLADVKAKKKARAERQALADTLIASIEAWVLDPSKSILGADSAQPIKESS